MITPGNNYNEDENEERRVNQSMENMHPINMSNDRNDNRHMHTEGDVDIHRENIAQLDNVLDSIADS